MRLFYTADWWGNSLARSMIYLPSYVIAYVQIEVVGIIAINV